ncbi:zinc-ribbon domain-containing protein [Celeribacter sp.]|uniref:zinc-ribbon domain-containing protein n=1 Tax=Celeribacter sp. TaxID=1890673 RepID=UPI003A8EAAE5
MRLNCPNCDAQYEVDEKVIPEQGRDVQCSNCGHTWFQRPAHLDHETAAEQGVELTADDGELDIPQAEEAAPHESDTSIEAASATDTPDIASAPAFSHDDDIEDVRAEISEALDTDDSASDDADDAAIAEAVAAFASDAEADQSEASPFASEQAQDDTFDEAEEYEDEADDFEPATGAKPATTISDDIRDILREEREFSAPAASTDTLESQPDLGIDNAAADGDAGQGLREKMARLRGLDPSSDPALIAGAAHGKRRDLLPDIEEINSTLSATSERDPDGTVPDEETLRTRERSSFRRVFIPLVVIAIALVVLYMFAPTIAEKVPALAGTMEAYVTAANGFRTGLDGVMAQLSDSLDGLLSSLTSGAEAASE